MRWVWLILLTTSLTQGPSRFWVCLVASHPVTKENMTTMINDDQWEYYQKKYPGSYKGTCKEKP